METASTANDLMNYKAREARETKNPNLRLKNLDNLREKASDAFLYCGLKV